MSNYYSVCNSNDVIQHFGIKGMKWGHKKTRESIAKGYLDKGYTREAAYNKADKKRIFKEIKETSKKYKDNVKKHFPDGISGGAGKKFQERFKQRGIEMKNLASDLDSQNSRLKKVVEEIKKNNRNSNFDGYRKQLAENRKLLDSML